MDLGFAVNRGNTVEGHDSLLELLSQLEQETNGRYDFLIHPKDSSCLILGEKLGVINSRKYLFPGFGSSPHGGELTILNPLKSWTLSYSQIGTFRQIHEPVEIKTCKQTQLHVFLQNSGKRIFEFWRLSDQGMTSIAFILTVALICLPLCL